MKKNMINAFSEKETALSQISGGFRWDGTYDSAGTTQCDSELKTEPGDDSGDGSGVNETNNTYRDGVCYYDS